MKKIVIGLLQMTLNKKIGFNSDFNEVSIFYKNDKIERLKYKPKSEIQMS